MNMKIEGIFDPIERFEDFIKSYRTEDGTYKYRVMLQKMSLTGSKSLIIDFEDLLRFDPELAKKTLENPEEFIESASRAIKNVMLIEDPDYAKKIEKFYPRFKNLPEKISLRKIRSHHIGQLVAIDGIITRASEVKPQLIEAVFECQRCHEKIVVLQEEGKYTPPVQCTNPTCRRKGPFKLIVEESKFIDWQKIRVQERPEDLPPGQLPRFIDAYLKDDLVDIARPGDRVTVIGILKTSPEFGQRGRKTATFRVFIETNYVELTEKEAERLEITPEEEQKILELAKDQWIHKKIIRSIAPSIYGYDDIKEAIALLLFGGVPKTLPDGMRIRGEPNILLVGDPGTAKSQLLRYVARIAPRGIYTSGKGSTAAGLTAAVIRDPETGGMSLEAGALVLSDRGVACIDEFDKMNPQDRVAIHEAMEQQSYHPFFEITLADGTKVKIGDFVDDLFEQFPDRKIDGINCEILPVSDLNIEILTTDFDKIFKTKINRVSRHKAPSRFIKILYSNGREVLVTPEHPIFVFENGEIKTISADKVKTGVFVPAVEEIEFKGSYRLDTDIANGRKKVILPETMQGPIARFLGYYVAEGYSYNGTAAEVGLSNTNQDIISSMKSVVEEVFGISPIDYVNVNRTLRIVSKSLYNYMSKNFPELMKRSTDKRIPQKIFVAGTRERIEFLKTAFEGDGSIESEAIAYSTSSKGLAEDYQDLLLTLGIHSRICKDTYDASKGTLKRCRYKVYITGDSLKKFVDNIIPELKSHEKLKKLVERSEKTNRKHDVLPPYVGTMIIKCLKKLGMPYNGYFNEHINRNYGITREVVNRYLDIIESKIKEIEKIIRDINDLRKLRQTIGYSQAKVAKLINVTRSTVDYMERGGYDPEKRNNLLCKFKTTVLREIEEAKEIVNKIKRLKKFRWLRVKSVEVVSNRGELGTEWVYDITVEPTRNFISHGLVLHNTISIAKAGIVATLNARTAILAAANPKLGRYDPYRPPVDNINLPPTILSRFDLIFILTDRPRVEVDKQVAEHILALHQMRTVEPPIPPDILRKYIAYARKNVHPVLTPEAAKRIEQFYLELRSVGEAPTSPVPITARQLEALIRLAEAHARMALRDKVTAEDAEEAIRLMKLSLQQVGIDSETGQLDIDLIMTGHSKSQRDKMEKILDLIDELGEDVDKAIPVSKLIERANVEGIDEEFVKRAIERMKKEGIIFEPRPGFVKKA